MNRKTVSPASAVAGSCRVPSDKSISHRSVILGALAEGVSTVENFLMGEDCLRTAEAFRSMGVTIEQTGSTLRIHGKGLNGLHAPSKPVDCGNSGTTTRLLMGVLTGQPFVVGMVGDASLSKRPMKRVMEPLRKMGARFYSKDSADPQHLPLSIEGSRPVQPIRYDLPMASAQVKSAILLAGLYANGETEVSEPAASRDHTERMFAGCGVALAREGNRLRLKGPARLNSFSIRVPGDISSAAFPLVAGLLLGKPSLTITGVNTNPTRTGILDVIRSMKGDLVLSHESMEGGEPVADLTVRRSDLSATSIGGAMIPRLIDELPIIAVLATQASGATVVSDAGELRVKESDRITTLREELSKMGAKIDEKPDGFTVHGPTRLKGAVVRSHGDHRLAMSLAVAGLIAEGDTTIEDIDCIHTSFPTFWELYAAWGQS